ncbi:MAG: caspase family protein [Pseudomonadota bacterium]
MTTGLFRCVAVCLLALCGAILSSGQALAERRIALVIGNSAYQHTTTLLNPSNDAEDVAAKLRRLQFDVITGNDLTGDEFSQLVVEFAQRLQGADVALLFYAGHGIQFRDTNYLVPIDARLNNQFSLKREAIALDDILEQMESLVPTNLVFLDACRNNPLTDVLQKSIKSTGRSATLARGLAKVDSRGNETLITFAAAPGAIAADGKGRNSPFTRALLKHIDTPGVEIEVMLKRVTKEVRSATREQQRPERLSRLTREFYFNGRTGGGKTDVAVTSPTEPAAPAPQPKPQVNKQLIELTFWNSIKDSKDEQDYQDYISKFPGGAFSDLAMRRIARLQDAKTRSGSGGGGWTPPQPPAPQPAPPPPVRRVEPGFNCAYARHPTEIAICNSNRLARYDLTINQVYARLSGRLNRSNRRRLSRNQKRWLRKRNRCGRNVGCIERAYRTRINVLRAFAGG